MRSMIQSLCLILLTILLVLSTQPRAQSQLSVVSERVVIDGYNEPNTPPNVAISGQLAQAITDPAAKNPDGTVNLNKALYVRFYDANRAPSNPPKFIVVMFPGIVAGANSLSILGSEIVRASGGDIEFWAIDRRTNLLEDSTAMIQAEMLGTKEAAMSALNAYANHPAYPGGYIRNHPFEVSPFMAEWGLDVHLRDAKAVIDAAGARVGSASKVFLGGDFIGAAMAQAFAAYSFDNIPGYTLIGGLILLDFTLAPGAPTNLTRIDPLPDDLYLNGGMVPNNLRSPLAGQSIAGLNNLRNPQRRFNITNPDLAGHEPFVVTTLDEPTGDPATPRRVPFEPYTFQLMEIAAQLALWDRDGATPLGLPHLPVRATNSAAFGILLDDEFQQTVFARWSIGFLQVPPGGSVNDVAVVQDDPAQANPNGIFAPRSLNPGLQRWEMIRDLSTIGLQGLEPTDFQKFARAFLYGSGNTELSKRAPNSLDWYMSERLFLDTFGIAPSLDASKFSEAVKTAMRDRGGKVLALTENKKVNVPLLALRAERGPLQKTSGFAGQQVFSFLVATYRGSTSITTTKVKVKGTNFPDFAHGDLITSTDKGTEGKSVADYIIAFANGKL